MDLLTVKDLSFAYPKTEGLTLDGISLSVKRGGFYLLCGYTGCGKTTLLRLLKPELAPFGQRSGEIIYAPEFGAPPAPHEIGMVTQDPNEQIVTDKVWHELAFGLENLGFDQRTMRTRVAEMASYFGIQSWFHKDVEELSGGQKQLLNLASIMAMQPNILILDEPTSQLDPIAASDFLNTVRKINLELGTTIIITEHRLEDIFHASDKVIVMEKGKVIVQDEPKAVGRYLKDENSEMFAALPAPVQIYYGVAKEAGFDMDDLKRVPLTVREGRTWLSELFEGKEVLPLKEKEDVPVKDVEEDPAISLKDVWFRYDRDLPDVLKGTTFDVGRGKIFALVGGNGTGKSTMLKAICRSIRPYRGKLLIDGKKLDSYKSGDLFKGKLAMLPQDPKSLFVKTTVREELEEMLGTKEAARYEKEVEIKGFENVPLDERIRQVAEECDILHLLKSHPFDLSGGEQQRTALAKVLLTEPKILLLDEPTKGIDNFFKLQFANILRKLQERGVTILMVSHDVEFCARYADQVGMFFDGDVITTNTPDKFFGQNSFYTTAANRMSRHLFTNAITDEDVIQRCLENIQSWK